MPIKIPNNLPAADILEAEGIMVMPQSQAARQDIRALRIALLNLMPNKTQTETQLARLIAATPLQVELTLMRISSYTPRNTSPQYLDEFYKSFGQVENEKFDGLIITGAPIELLEFENVDYWQELEAILEWSRTHVHSLFGICWGAQAALNHFYNVPKQTLPEKAFGVIRHKNLQPTSPYLRGFSDDFYIPVSRWTEVRRQDIDVHQNLNILMESAETGPGLVEDKNTGNLFIFNHFEYDSTSLAEEFNRDVDAGISINVPANYFPDDDPKREPENRWRSHAHLLFGNWINQVYQTVPFDLENIGSER
jgi:homoserine O-succinyltransferase